MLNMSNSADPDETPRSAASHLRQRHLYMPLLDCFCINTLQPRPHNFSQATPLCVQLFNRNFKASVESELKFRIPQIIQFFGMFHICVIITFKISKNGITFTVCYELNASKNATFTV